MIVYKNCIIYVICSLLIDNFCYGSTIHKTYKIIVIGDKGVGKKSLISKLIEPQNKPDEYKSILPGDKSIYEYTYKDGVKYNFEIWSACSTKEYEDTNKIFSKKSNGIMAVYDITDRNTFDNLNNRIDSVLKVTGEEIPIIITANKSDLYESAAIETEEGEEFAKKWNADFKEIATTDYENVKEAFGILFDKVISPVPKKQEQPIVEKGKEKEKTCCCCPCVEKKVGEKAKEDEKTK